MESKKKKKVQLKYSRIIKAGDIMPKKQALAALS